MKIEEALKDLELQKVGFELTDESIKRIILNLARNRGEKTFTDKDINIIINWATRTSVDSNLLQSVLNFHLLIDVKDGEITFKEVEKIKKIKDDKSGG